VLPIVEQANTKGIKGKRVIEGKTDPSHIPTISHIGNRFAFQWKGHLNLNLEKPSTVKLGNLEKSNLQF